MDRLSKSVFEPWRPRVLLPGAVLPTLGECPLALVDLFLHRVNTGCHPDLSLSGLMTAKAIRATIVEVDHILRSLTAGEKDNG